MGELTIADTAKQPPACDRYYRASAPGKSTDMLPIGPFKMWISHLITVDGLELRQVAELVQLNERTLRRILGTPEASGRNKQGPKKAQERVSFDLVDWALTKADGRTQLWHLYPELYEDFTNSDIEISD